MLAARIAGAVRDDEERKRRDEQERLDRARGETWLTTIGAMDMVIYELHEFEVPTFVERATFTVPRALPGIIGLQVGATVSDTMTECSLRVACKESFDGISFSKPIADAERVGATFASSGLGRYAYYMRPFAPHLCFELSLSYATTKTPSLLVEGARLWLGVFRVAS